MAAVLPMRSLQRAQIKSVGTVFLRLRPLLVAPPVLVAWTLLWPTAPHTQSVLVTILSGSLLAFFTAEAVIARRREVGERWLFRSLLVTLIGLLGASFATGALASPFVPLLFAPAVTAFAAFGRSRASATMLALLVVGVLALASVPTGFPFPPIALDVRNAMIAVTVVLAAALLWVGVTGLSDAHEQAGNALDRLRAELLAGAGERAMAVESIGAKVAHEIRNPLTAIRGLVDLLAPTAADDRAKRRFEVVASEVARIEGILRDYLGFARPLAELRLQSVRLDRIVADVLDILDARAHAAGVAFVPALAPVELRADPQRLTEALLNLVGNAIEACDRGGTVRVDVEAGARIVVRDDGRGMGPEQLARLGTPYASSRPGGTGLGVVLARQAIAQHGGTVVHES
ncbi:MAG TPA: ATP-binding protein, partial [Nannocystaceae bacterium]|nr:ATP-binding protein [Nannocystaceae bacterium]